LVLLERGAQLGPGAARVATEETHGCLREDRARLPRRHPELLDPARGEPAAARLPRRAAVVAAVDALAAARREDYVRASGRECHPRHQLVARPLLRGSPALAAVLAAQQTALARRKEDLGVRGIEDEVVDVVGALELDRERREGVAAVAALEEVVETGERVDR